MTRYFTIISPLVVTAVAKLLLTPTYAYSTKAEYAQEAFTGIKTLNSNWYSQDTGLWDGAWWQSANALTTLADFAILHPTAANSLGIANIIQNTFKNAPKKFPGFIAQFYDDEGWWALGLIHSYDATSDEKYLETAADIFKDMENGGGTPCMGGIFSSKDCNNYEMSRHNNAHQASIDMSVEYARGSFKKVYRGKYIKGSRAGESCICKVFITGSVFEAPYFRHELAVVEKVTDIVSANNALELIDKKIIINQPQIWKFERDKVMNLVEPMIDNFEKFNSNTGWVQNKTPWGQVMQALAHFSYHHSSGQFTLCDLQGGVYSDGIVLTDLVVMSVNRRFGPTDLGKDGIENFFTRHVCSSYYRSSWARPRRKPDLFQARKGTAMIQVETQTGRSPLTYRYY